ncbi:MAG TPA: gamma-glutamyl-gamma-aminobutyrate hydrolase family protein [Methylomirabilota bacterium]|jgi:putative glutamine amidotransferase|nr:gamma-glutamyl-gamma-aminobutyrate hydrolase family protein [Methylomirabilota bacterium]
MVAPLIGITTSVTVDKIPERAYVNGTYIRAVQEAGGIPLLLTPHFTPEVQAALWQRLDGLILTGGGDIEPERFGEARHPAVDDVSPARDDLEIGLTQRALSDDVPLFAICRGIQVLNVALGGTLVQDIPSEWPNALVHSQKAPRHEPTHAVKVMGEGTRLGRVLGTLEVDVNSMHHQAIKQLGEGLREVAWAPDGIVEGVEMPGEHRFVLGVQWHPEELVGHDQAARNLFAAIVEAARRRAGR